MPEGMREAAIQQVLDLCSKDTKQISSPEICLWGMEGEKLFVSMEYHKVILVVFHRKGKVFGGRGWGPSCYLDSKRCSDTSSEIVCWKSPPLGSQFFLLHDYVLLSLMWLQHSWKINTHVCRGINITHCYYNSGDRVYFPSK